MPPETRRTQRSRQGTVLQTGWTTSARRCPVHDLELELSGARPMPSPAIRTPSAPAMSDPDADVRSTPSVAAPPAAAAPAAASPAAALPSMSADEVTRTLANLADLRDRGAISAEMEQESAVETRVTERRAEP